MTRISSALVLGLAAWVCTGCAKPRDSQIERDLLARHPECEFSEARHGKLANGRRTVAVLYRCPGDVQDRSDLYRYELRGEAWVLTHPRP